MHDVKRQPRAEACYLCPCHPWHSAVPTDQRMSTFLIQIVLLAAGAVYFGSDDHYVYAAYAASGKPKWSYRTGGPIQSGVAVAGRTVVAGNTDGTVYGLLA